MLPLVVHQHGKPQLILELPHHIFSFGLSLNFSIVDDYFEIFLIVFSEFLDDFFDLEHVGADEDEFLSEVLELGALGALDEFPCEFGGGGKVLDKGFAFDVGHGVVETLLVLVVLVFFLEFVLELLVLFGALLVLVSHHFRLQILVEILLLILLQFLRNLFL